VAENSPRLQHPSDIESTEREIETESAAAPVERHLDVLEEGVGSEQVFCRGPGRAMVLPDDSAYERRASEAVFGALDGASQGDTDA
jgi:hypothetical protein